MPSASDGDAGGDVGGRRVRRAGRAVAIEAGRRGADAADRVPFHQQRIHREAREQVDPQLLGPLAEPADDLADRRREVAAVVHGGRRGDPERLARRQEVHRFGVHVAAEGKVGVLEVGKELAEGARVDDRTGEIVLAQAFGFLEDGDIEIVVLGQPRQLDGARESGRPRTHDRHVHLERFGGRRVGEDQPVERERRLVAGGQNRGHGVS